MLLEGAKVSQALVNQTLNDPAMTFGFEAEMYISGIEEFLKHSILRDTTEDDEGYFVKPLEKITWNDIQNYFSSLNRNPHDMLGTEKTERLIELIYDNHPDVDISEDVTEDQLLDFLRQHYSMLTIITALGVWPSDGFSDLDTKTQNMLEQIIKTRNIKRAQTLNGMDTILVRLFHQMDTSHLDPNNSYGGTDVFYGHLAQVLESVLGESVRVIRSSSQEKEYNDYSTWTITADLSLPEIDGYISFELVSPKMSLENGYASLMRVLELMRTPGSIIPESTILTTKDCGLHINIGREGGEVDYVKLLFLMGDEYLASRFDRVEFDDVVDMDNKYKKQTFDQMVRGARTMNPQEFATLARSFMHGFSPNRLDIQKIDSLFRQAVPFGHHNSVDLSKLERGYVEFRAPGNEGYEKNPDLVAQAVRQMAVMLKVATDPQMYRKEYLSRMYRVVMKLIQQEIANQQKKRRIAQKALPQSQYQIAAESE